ncbi:hypothetical protein HPB50_019533 [Hyalomma asiaticum]|uniref:Uncharacterized protein n=1 Tax=Hyalomma asiaticum TaxID=266040 RepID=A0ACB7RQT4_HYAAI|nr:hypothetical protein HPB50_019533 [Hyalomma asiaticum]
MFHDEIYRSPALQVFLGFDSPYQRINTLKEAPVMLFLWRPVRHTPIKRQQLMRLDDWFKTELRPLLEQTVDIIREFHILS